MALPSFLNFITKKAANAGTALDDDAAAAKVVAPAATPVKVPGPAPEQAPAPDINEVAPPRVNERGELDISDLPLTAAPPASAPSLPQKHGILHTLGTIFGTSMPNVAPGQSAPNYHEMSFAEKLGNVMRLAGGVGAAGALAAGTPAQKEIASQHLQYQQELPARRALQAAQLQQMDTENALREAQTERERMMAQSVTVYDPVTRMPMTVPLPLAQKLIPTAWQEQGRNTRNDANIQAKKDIAQLHEGIAMPVPADLAQEIGMPQLAGKAVGGSVWKEINNRLAASGKNLVVTDIGDKRVLLRKDTGDTVRVLGTAPGLVAAKARAQEWAYAKATWTPFQTVDGRLINIPQALAEGRAGASSPLIRLGYNSMLPAYDADSRLKVMMQNNELAQKAEQQGDPKSAGSYDMVLLFNHMAMTGGDVKGMRMGEMMTQQHAQARGIGESLRVQWNRLCSGSQLSQEQRDNFTTLAWEIRNAKWQQSRMKAQALGVNTDELPSDPDLPEVPASGIVGQGVEAAQQQFQQANQQGSVPQALQGTVKKPKPNTTSPKFRVGQTVKLRNGQTVKIKAVHPDGTFDVE